MNIYKVSVDQHKDIMEPMANVNKMKVAYANYDIVEAAKIERLKDELKIAEESLMAAKRQKLQEIKDEESKFSLNFEAVRRAVIPADEDVMKYVYNSEDRIFVLNKE